MFPTMTFMPGPFGQRFPVPTGLPMPGSMPVPPSMIPALPLPPWPAEAAPPVPMTPQWSAEVVPPTPMIPQAPGAGAAAGGLDVPPSAMDLQTTVSFNPASAFVPESNFPKLAPTVFVAPHAAVIGDVTAGDDVFIGFGATLRADYGSPFHIGPRCSIQDHVVVHGEPGQFVEGNGRTWSVFLDEGVSCLHNAVIHGPVRVGRNVYIGAGGVLHSADVGDDCVIMHNATVTGGVRIPPGRFVAPGKSVWRQEEADHLPLVPPELTALNPRAVAGCTRLAEAYRTQMPLAIVQGN